MAELKKQLDAIQKSDAKKIGDTWADTAKCILGSRLNRHQNATTAARASAEAKLRASSSSRVAMRRKSFRRQKTASMRQRSRERCLSSRILRVRARVAG